MSERATYRFLLEHCYVKRTDDGHGCRILSMNGARSPRAWAVARSAARRRRARRTIDIRLGRQHCIAQFSQNLLRRGVVRTRRGFFCDGMFRAPMAEPAARPAPDRRLRL